MWNKKMDPEKTLCFKDRVKIGQRHDFEHQNMYIVANGGITLYQYLQIHKGIYSDCDQMKTLRFYVKWMSRLRFAEPETSTTIQEETEFFNVCIYVKIK